MRVLDVDVGNHTSPTLEGLVGRPSMTRIAITIEV
jgi:hypothetical protein